MKNVNSISRHLGAVWALAAATTIASASIQPAAAAQGIYGGGGSLFSIAFRQLADCYHGINPDDSVVFKDCNIAGRPNQNVEAFYADVGSSAGRRAFISNDQRQLLQGSASPLSLPAVQPLYLDAIVIYLRRFVFPYPYPRMDMGASDDPLPAALSAAPFTGFSPATGWQTLSPPPATPITAVVGASVSYDRAKLGAPIQLPAAEVGVAIGVNAPKPSAAPWQISYQGANVMHLSQPQICAIFAAAVTDWSDSSTTIAYRNSANVLQSELFSAGNTPSGNPYTSSSLPITVAYRSDGSGTTFIMTNFLSNVCPFFDNGSNRYQKIFAPTASDITAGYKAIPTTQFSDLIANINKAFPARATTTAAWIGQSGNLAVAGAISNNNTNPTFSGRIGYISSDFISSSIALPSWLLAKAPLEAAVQNEAQRLAGVFHPSAATPFVTPTPSSIAIAWKDLKSLSPVADYANWNVYAQTHLVYGGQTKSVLATPTRVGAYPLSGTAYLYFYSCYADPTGVRVPAITDFLSWLYAGSSSAYPAGFPSTSTRNAPNYHNMVKIILRRNGFNPIRAAFADRIIKYFVNDTYSTSITAYKTSGGQIKGCKNVTGGGAL